MISRDLYKGAVQHKFSDGTIELERTQYKHKNSIGDIIHTIMEGDTLTLLAYRYYGEPLYWYLIADINNVLNPFDLSIGVKLIIPNIKNYK